MKHRLKKRLNIGLAALMAGVLGIAQAGIEVPFWGGKAIAAQFEQKEVEQTKYIAVAMPLASGHFKLIVLHQASEVRPCWREQGVAPVVVDPLLVTFDFTGICGRSTDSNGYSIRVAGEDLVIRYSLTIEGRGNELVLIGRARDGSGPPMLIARTQGRAEGFQKLILEPGWRFSRRTYGGKTLGHIYFTNDSYNTATAGSLPPLSPPSPQLQTEPVPPGPKLLAPPLESSTTPIPVPSPANLSLPVSSPPPASVVVPPAAPPPVSVVSQPELIRQPVKSPGAQIKKSR
jgi:Protein of unknown function (DUF3747)